MFFQNLSAQSLEWEFPIKEIENPPSEENDEIWFQASRNDLPSLFKTDRAKFSSDDIRCYPIYPTNPTNPDDIECKKYDGILGGEEGCKKKNGDYAIGTKDWPQYNSPDYSKYIQVSFTVEDLACYDLENTSNELNFKYRRSSEGPKNLMIELFIDNKKISLKDISLKNIKLKKKWKSLSYNLDVLDNGKSVKLLQYIKENNKKKVEIRFYGYNASSYMGTLRLDNIKLDFSEVKENKPILSDIKVKL